MEKIRKQNLKDRLVTFLILLSLVILVIHLSNPEVAIKSKNDSDKKLHPELQRFDSLTASPDSIWKNTEFMQD